MKIITGVVIGLCLLGMSERKSVTGNSPSGGLSDRLPGTAPLTWEGDLGARMVSGIDTFLDRETAASRDRRSRHWQRDFSSPEAYTKSISDNRQRFLRVIGVRDERVAPDLQIVSSPTSDSTALAKSRGYSVYEIRWTVLPGVEGEGLLLEPKSAPRAQIIALPDCDWTPESAIGLQPGVPERAQFPRRLAKRGVRVIVPFLIDRRDTYSGIAGIRMTNQPHREFLYRAGYELGRHLIGYEVQKVMALLDWFEAKKDKVPTGVIGYGEGGLIALYAGAADERIRVTGVSGYFQPRERLWREPIYRNVFGLLDEFGDAELASLIAPRVLVVEASRHPEVAGPPAPRADRTGGAPGAIETPPYDAVAAEAKRAQELTPGFAGRPWLQLLPAAPDSHPGGEAFLKALLAAVGIASTPPSRTVPSYVRPSSDSEIRRERQFRQILDHTQRSLREAEFERDRFWARANPQSERNPETWKARSSEYRDYLWNEVIGRFPDPSMPANPRSRKVYDTDRVAGYEVVLDVFPDVIAYGILLMPKDLKQGERRPVVVCQHGLEGRPTDVADPGQDHPAYHRYAYRLAELGFITYAPQNPYLGADRFRVLQRKSNPLKRSLFSIITAQHQRTLEWLAGLPWVDPRRLAFYGLSYGGKTAMRVPALLEQYCLSICSADYNEWIWKNASARHRFSYLITGEYDMPEFDLGNTFNYAEMSWLICPRPFMVERGHHDGVAPDEWVAYEYARTRRRYVNMGLSERTEIEFFDGPHTINGKGTFAFLQRHLNWEGSGKLTQSTTPQR